MTKLLDEAIKRVRELPEADQDEAAQILFSLAARARPVTLDEETRAAVEEGRQQARQGEFATPDQIARLFRHK